MSARTKDAGRTSGRRRAAIALFALAWAAPAVLKAQSAARDSETSFSFAVLHSFTGADGANPRAGVVIDSAGNLYGTTVDGGRTGCLFGSGCGVVFEVSRAGSETVLYTFVGGTDGGRPYAGLVRDVAGNLYGTTLDGGADNEGVVFKVTPSGQETVLHTFTGAPDGAFPVGGLIRDSSGDLFGTTEDGGPHTCGIIFEISPPGQEAILYDFLGAVQGGYPLDGLIRDSAGNFYGTAADGADNQGVVFKLTASGQETVLYTFTGGADGGQPQAGLVRDSSGNLYGTALAGGAHNAGVVFKMTASGQETVLYSFTGGADGGAPVGGLLRDPFGNLYGTTSGGGDTTACKSSGGCGVVFELSPTGREEVLYTFTGGADGANPEGTLVRDSSGALYGTASAGGSTACGESGCGVVFKLTP